MIEYILIYGLVFLCGIAMPKCYRKKSIYVIFAIITLLIGLRHPSMGLDLGYYRGYGYLYSYKDIASFKWTEIFRMLSYLNYEKGYILLNKVLAMLAGDNVQVLLMGCAILSIFPFVYVLSKKNVNNYLTIIVFMGLPSFVMLFSGLRQCIAMAICFYSIIYIEKKQFFKFLLIVLFASLFHYTAIFYILAYLFYHLRVDKNLRILSILSFGVIFALRRLLFRLLTGIIGKNVLMDNNGSVTMMLAFIIVYIVVSLLSKKNSEQQNYINILYLACVCQIFGNVFDIAARLGYYFLTILILLIPAISKTLVGRRQKVIYIMFVSIGFVFLGLYLIYNTYWAMAYPYQWFWEMR